MRKDQWDQAYGFPLPEDGYLKAVREQCHKYGSLYIADEVQTGLGRTGNVWGITTFVGIIPDILVTGNGLLQPACKGRPFLTGHNTRIVAVSGRHTALYIAQKKLPDANFGHKLIHHLDDDSSLDLIEDTIREIVKIWNFNSANKPYIELAIDGQLSNWMRDSENNQRLCYIDTSTPLFPKQGVEQQNPELLLKSAPGFLRWIIRLFFLQDVVTRYYSPRLVFMDLIANLHKEQKPELIEPAIEYVNAHLPHDQAPLTKIEVDKYYREDKLIWIVFLGLRRLDRFFTILWLRKRYEFILPGKIKR